MQFFLLAHKDSLLKDVALGKLIWDATSLQGAMASIKRKIKAGEFGGYENIDTVSCSYDESAKLIFAYIHSPNSFLGRVEFVCYKISR